MTLLANDAELTNAMRAVIKAFGQWDKAKGAERRLRHAQLCSALQRAFTLTEKDYQLPLPAGARQRP
jgi:hypothetical protein